MRISKFHAWCVIFHSDSKVMQLLVVFVTNDIGGDGGGVVTSIANSSCAAGMAFSWAGL